MMKQDKLPTTGGKHHTGKEKKKKKNQHICWEPNT
jgi:hypothetical protein